MWTLLLSGGILLMPMMMLFTQSIWEKDTEIERLEQQIQAINWVPDLYDALDNITQYRGFRGISELNPGYFDFAKEHLAVLEIEIAMQMDEMLEVSQQFPDSYPPKAEFQKDIERIELVWLEQQGERFKFSEMSSLVLNINHILLRLLPQHSGLLSILMEDIPNLRESMAQIRGAGSVYLSQLSANRAAGVQEDSDLTIVFMERIQRNQWNVENQFVRLRNSLEYEGENIDEQLLSILYELVVEIQELRDLVEWELIDTSIVSYETIEFFEEGTDPIDILHTLAINLQRKSLLDMQKKLHELEAARNWMILLVSVTVLIALLLAYRNTRQMILGVRQGVQVLQEMGQGQFQQTIESTSDRGEIGLLMAALSETQQQLKQHYSQLQRERLFSSSLTSSMDNGVYALDQRGGLLFMNHAAETLLGWSNQELGGVNMHDAVHVHQEDGVLVEGECPIFQSLARGKSYQAELDWMRRKDGLLIPVELNASPLLIEGDVNGSVVVFQGISERLEMEQQLRGAVEEAKQASKAKGDFLASMSHELRTPLTSIIGYGELLQQSTLDHEQQSLLGTIDVASRTLLALVNDILDLSKIEEGKFSIEASPFDLGETIREVVALFKRRAESEGLRLLVEQPFQFKHQRIGDRLRLTQILFNLLGNAVKFTREGEISITLSQEQEGGHSVYHFSVKDSGIGIGQEVLDRLFQPFEQADSSISRQFGGTGLGLHISRLFADLMGGEIRVKSELHVGSTFTLVVPLEKSEAIVEQELVKVVSNQQMRIQGRVLIADDTAELQVLIKRLVESVGMVVDLAANGQEAYEMAMEHPYDLVLMDMQMPEVDGIEATRWLRREGNDVPIVALTGNVMVQHRRQFEEAGCNDFLAKPIDRNKLLKVLVRYQREQNSEEVKESVAASNHEQLKVPDLVDEDLVGMFVDRLQQALPVIQQRYESQRWSGLQQEVHVLKGSGATFGFPQITARARELEGVIKQEQYELVPSAMAELMSLIVQIIEWHQQR